VASVPVSRTEARGRERSIKRKLSAVDFEGLLPAYSVEKLDFPATLKIKIAISGFYLDHSGGQYLYYDLRA